jgi:LacI family transcriptional regulator
MHMQNDHAVALIERNVVVRSRRSCVSVIETSSLPSPSSPLAPPPQPPRLRHVLLRVDMGTSFGRGVIAGVARYNRERNCWSICIRPEEYPQFSGDGIITLGAGHSRRDDDSVPIVDLSGATPAVGVDATQVARLAAQHLLERGMQQFAFVGPTITGSAGAKPFRRAIERNGKSCVSYSCEDAAPGHWDAAQEHMAAWIASLPKPVGIMAADDAIGLAVLDACRRANVCVPDDAAVVGVGNDQTLCNLAIPPLSSIDANAEGVGYDAAALLDRLMNGGGVGGGAPARPVKLAPRGVITRRSTDIVAAEDEEVARAVSFIRERACGGLQVGDVLAHTGMSRASLQHRMKQLLGRTIHQEIQRARLNRAKHLLAMSGQTIKQVARESGFASVQYMTRVFRAETGETPARFRNRRTV